MVLLLNYVIAILSSTFAAYEDKQLGLYYEVVIKQFAMMDYDEEYGFIACGTPPMNVLVFFLFWLQPLVTHRGYVTKRKFNEFVCFVIYMPYGLAVTIIFAAIALVTTPLSYCASVLRLAVNLPMDTELTEIEMACKFLQFVVLAPVFLFISFFLDVYNFFKHLFSKHSDEFHEKDHHLFNLTEEGFQEFEDTIESFEELAAEQRDKVSMVEINKALRENMQIHEQIQTLLYSQHDGQKFIRKPSTNQSILNPVYLRRIREYVTLKRIVCDTAHPHLGGLVEFSLLQSFVKEVHTRAKVISLYQRQMGETPDEDKIRQQALNELSVVNPNAVWHTLS